MGAVGHVSNPSGLGFRAAKRAPEPLPVGETRVARCQRSLRHRGINGGDPLAGSGPFMPRKAVEFSCAARGQRP
ncbi:hypothetical protein C3731_02335 [Brucella oryzae]|uniref:Uncharacterized protein n=1 Tax=Brucella oryzae TaxID=335286 RepID=A0A2S7J4A6_9HYPH|nr:hypothetical protein C3731_02335 [Brucella oryzae]